MVKHYSEKEIEEKSNEYNKIFTIFQELDKKVSSWDPLKEDTKDKWDKILSQQHLNALSVQTHEMKRSTNWFITLTITNIVVLILTLILNS